MAKNNRKSQNESRNFTKNKGENMANNKVKTNYLKFLVKTDAESSLNNEKYCSKKDIYLSAEEYEDLLERKNRLENLTALIESDLVSIDVKKFMIIYGLIAKSNIKSELLKVSLEDIAKLTTSYPADVRVCILELEKEGLISVDRENEPFSYCIKNLLIRLKELQKDKKL